MRVEMPHGSAIELGDDGAPQRWRAPDGAVIATIEPAAVRLDLAGLHDRPVTVGGPVEPHPVLGPVQGIRAAARGARDDDEAVVVARVEDTDWRRPARVPAIDVPGRLPVGVGTTLLNVLALGAQAAGRALRYAGPSPTPSLRRSLRECFRIEGDELPVDLVPAPFERVRIAPRAVVHLRDGVERLYLGGLAWGPGPTRRLVRVGDTVRAVLWIGDAPWAEAAELGADGALRAGPRPLPPIRSGVLGKPFSPGLIGAILERITEGEPPLLAGAMREVTAGLAVVWGDPGADVARLIAGVLLVHAGLWERLGGGPAGALAQHLAAAVALPLRRLAQRRLETIPVGAALH